MKVGNTINGLTVADVKRVNKLNLIQFLKEVDSYLQQGYNIDVNSARQVGLVLMTNMFKTEAASSVKAGSTDVGSVEPELETTKVEEGTIKPVAEATEQSVEEAIEEEAPVTPKKTTTRSKNTVQ